MKYQFEIEKVINKCITCPIYGIDLEVCNLVNDTAPTGRYDNKVSVTKPSWCPLVPIE